MTIAGTDMRTVHIANVVRGAHNSGANTIMASTATLMTNIISGLAYNRFNNINIINKNTKDNKDTNTTINTGQKIGLNYLMGTNNRESGDHFKNN